MDIFNKIFVVRLLPLRDLYVYICVYVYVASSGYYTLGMVMRVLCAEGLRDAKNHGCERTKRQPQKCGRLERQP